MEEPEQEPVKGGASNRRYESTSGREPRPSHRRREDYQGHFEYVRSFQNSPCSLMVASHCVWFVWFLLFRSFNQRWRSDQMRPCRPPLFSTPPYRAPPPLLPTAPYRGPPPLLPTPHPLGAWPGFKAGHHPVPALNNTFMPRYTFGEEPPHPHRKKKKHRTAHSSMNSPYTHWL